MFSRFLRATSRVGEWKALALSRVQMKVRKYSDLLPPNQYELPFPKRLQIPYVLRVYWETVPLFITTCVAIGILFYSIYWACVHKVDVVFTTHSRENLSRTMDLRYPTVHKILTINQRYEPWPEMADLLDKMKVAERRVLTRAQTCSLVARM